MTPFDLTNKTALITGINNPMGIGAATAKAMAQAGARVALVYKKLDFPYDPAKTAHYGVDWYHAKLASNADETVAQITATGQPYFVMECDLTQNDAIPGLFDAVEAKLGPVDILVNNAATYSTCDSIFDITHSNIDQILAINITALVMLTKEFVARYQRRNTSYGRVINLSTDAAFSFPGQIMYGASKAAVEALTRSIAMETGSMGITVNAVAPGPTQTGWLDDQSVNALKTSIPVARIGIPQDIANTILWLAAPQSEWLTGQVIKVCGGHFM